MKRVGGEPIHSRDPSLPPAATSVIRRESAALAVPRAHADEGDPSSCGLNPTRASSATTPFAHASRACTSDHRHSLDGEPLSPNVSVLGKYSQPPRAVLLRALSGTVRDVSVEGRPPSRAVCGSVKSDTVTPPNRCHMPPVNIGRTPPLSSPGLASAATPSHAPYVRAATETSDSTRPRIRVWPS